MSERLEGNQVPETIKELRQAAEQQGLDPYPDDPTKIIELIDKVYYPATDKQRPDRGEDSVAEHNES